MQYNIWLLCKAFGQILRAKQIELNLWFGAQFWGEWGEWGEFIFLFKQKYKNKIPHSK
jgi:hypothetical protein